MPRPPRRPQSQNQAKHRTVVSRRPAPPPEPPVKPPVSKPLEPSALQESIYEVEVSEGLERIAFSELRRRFDERIERIETGDRPGEMRFSYVGNPFQLLKLQTVQAAYVVLHFPVPRPKALLGHQHFTALTKQIAAVR
ncbi:MAG TPA: hypothetical protein VHO69_03830, partial [Phototrophicaceae bacterium]|nr:hypothetical protein [Phototrophicaceae bacterium]